MTSTFNYQRDNEGTYYPTSTLPNIFGDNVIPEVVSLVPEYTGVYLYGPNQRFVPDNSLDAYPGDRYSERQITGLNLNTAFGNNINKFLCCGVKFYSTNDPVHSGDPQAGQSLIYGRNGNSLRFTAISKNMVVTALHFTANVGNYAGQAIAYFYHNNQIISRSIQKVITLKLGYGSSNDGLVVYERVNGNIVTTNVTSDFLNYFSELSPSNYTNLREKLGSGTTPAFDDTVMFILSEPLPDDFVTPYILENDTLKDLMIASESGKYLHSIAIDQENHIRYCSRVFDNLSFIFNYRYKFFIDIKEVQNMFLNYTNLFLDETNEKIRLNKILSTTSFDTAKPHDSSSPIFWYDDTLLKPIIHGLVFFPDSLVPYTYNTNNKGHLLGSGSNPTTNCVQKFYNYLIQFGAISPSILKITDTEYLKYKNSVINFKNKHKNYEQHASKIIDNTIMQNSLFKLTLTTKDKKLTPFISFIPANTNITKTLEINNINYDELLTRFHVTNYHQMQSLPQDLLTDEGSIILKYSKYINNNSINSFKLIKNKYLVLIVRTAFNKLEYIHPDGRVLCNDSNELSYATTNVSSLFYNSEINAENFYDYSFELELFDEYDNQLHPLNTNYIYELCKIKGNTAASVPGVANTMNFSNLFYNFYSNKTAIESSISYKTTNDSNKFTYSNFNDLSVDNSIKIIDFTRIIGNLHIICKIFKNNILNKEYAFKFYRNNNSDVINVTGYNITNNNLSFYNEPDELLDLCPDSGTVGEFGRFQDVNYSSEYQIADGVALFPNIKKENINILDYPFGITTSEILQQAQETSTVESTNGTLTPTSSKITVQAVKNSSGTYDVIEIIESGE